MHFMHLEPPTVDTSVAKAVDFAQAFIATGVPHRFVDFMFAVVYWAILLYSILLVGIAVLNWDAKSI